MSSGQLQLIGLPALSMEDLVDKLIMLHYQREFCQKTSLKPLTRYYFTNAASNPNEQFFYFTSLFAWLNRSCGSTGNFETPGQFDDPNATTASILTELKRLSIPGDFSPGKIRQGYGEVILQILHAMVDKVFKHKDIWLLKPSHKGDDYAEEAEVDNDAEVTTENIEENVAAQADDDDDMYVENLPTTSVKKSDQGSSPAKEIKPRVDPAEWRLEIERVMPHLRVVIPNDNKDWRIHHEQMHAHEAGIKGALSDTSVQLGKLHEAIEKTLEKISSREKYINNQFESQNEEYRACQDRLSEIKQRFDKADGHVTLLTNELSNVSEELDNVKAQMDEIGSGMTDSKPLVNIKQGLVRLKTEIKQMDLRLGVIEHTVLNARLQSRGKLADGVRMNNANQIFAINVL